MNSRKIVLTIAFYVVAVTFLCSNVFGQLTYERLTQVKIDELHRKADAGDVKAQSELGQRYYFGIGVTRDQDRLGTQYLKKAYANDTTAKAVCYDLGIGVKKDQKEAVKLYQIAADGGDSVALNNLAILYSSGNGVKKDVVKAIELYRKASSKELAIADANLGIHYIKGEGVTQDAVKGFSLIRKAAEKGSDFGQLMLGICYGQGIGTNELGEEAVKWIAKSAQNGNKDAIAIIENLQKEAQKTTTKNNQSQQESGWWKATKEAAGKVGEWSQTPDGQEFWGGFIEGFIRGFNGE